MQYEKADDFVLGSGTSHSIKYLIEVAFSFIQVELCWVREGNKLIGYNTKSNSPIIFSELQNETIEPSEIIADTSKIKNDIGWETTRTIDYIIEELLKAEMDFD